MKFSIARDSLLKPLNLVAGVVERRQTLPILSNVLVSLDNERLALTGTDLEVELVGQMTLEAAGDSGEITVPARKLADICKSLPEGSVLQFVLDEQQRLQLRSGRSRFTLSTLPADGFPAIDQMSASHQFTLKQGQLKRLIDRTAFSMAQQDVRYYLNGMLFEVAKQRLRAVATDGHRLAMATMEIAGAPLDESVQVILPRKGVLELVRLLQDSDSDVQVLVGSNHFRAVTAEFTFTSKLIDGKFPDYERVLPRGANRALSCARSALRDALARTAILSNEKYRGVRLVIEQSSLQILANNPEQEEAEETLEVEYGGDRVEIGFNVGYLIDVLGALSGGDVRIQFSDGGSSVLIEEPGADGATYVVMPMRL
jgi:DNA polymerase III subunit beta